MEYVTIRHDGFARESLVRTKITMTGECANCGQNPRFRYGVQPESISGRISWDDRTFCGIDCRRSFYGCC